jgi:hypothetical protein
MMEIYAFGFNLISPSDSACPNGAFPEPSFRAKDIRVHWSSWCDAVVAYRDDPGPWNISYAGTGLTEAQKEHVSQCENLRHAMERGGQRKVLFFGSTMHDGLRGYVLSNRDDAENWEDQITLFATDVELEKDIPEVETYSVRRVLSDGSLVLSAKTRSTAKETITRFQDFEQLRTRLSSNSILLDSTFPPYVSHDPAECVTNATTITVLADDGKPWTSTRDPRYSKCLGRAYDGDSSFAAVPYLSETRVTRIASGGYMSAAMSADGELFLWGQACPGSTGELDVLNGNVELNRPMTGISAEDEQDEFVKCLEVHVDGHEARVYDVAVGHGHVLIAAEMSGSGGEKKQALFAGGDNSRNQLGLEAKEEFYKRFEEVAALRGKLVAQIVASGWYSLVVTLE